MRSKIGFGIKRLLRDAFFVIARLVVRAIQIVIDIIEKISLDSPNKSENDCCKIFSNSPIKSDKLPDWFKQEIPTKEVLDFSSLLKEKYNLNTVCSSARCPNQTRCFKKRHATFLILGDRCTRNCAFCAVSLNKETSVFDKDESYRIAQAVKDLRLEYVVVTSVTRDDLPDFGAGHFARTIKAIRGNNMGACPVRDAVCSRQLISNGVKIEVLIPDFKGVVRELEKVVREKPFIIAHNLETVESLYARIRQGSDYERSLDVLKNIKLINNKQVIKSSLMLGLGESGKEIERALIDLRGCDCDMLVLGQYLRPASVLYPVKKFYSPEEFQKLADFAYSIGFKEVVSEPLARTSFIK